MNGISRIFTVSVILLGISSGMIWAFSFSPISASLSPEGKDSTRSFQLKNDGDNHVAVRINLFTRKMDMDGNETMEPADELFTVYPDRVVLPPKSFQSVRIRWKGPVDLTKEQSYRILVEQVPVDFEGQSRKGSGLKIMFRYLGAIYITPDFAVPEVVLEKSTAHIVQEESQTAEFIFYNRGTKHAILTDLKLKIQGIDTETGESVSIEAEDLREIDGENILAGARRRVRLNLPADFTGEKVNVEFLYEQEE